MSRTSKLPSELVYGYPLILHSLLNSPEEAKLFYDHAQQVAEGQNVRAHHPLRVSTMQVSLAETEWNDTLLQHAVLFNEEFVPVHINLSTEPLYSKPIIETSSNYLIKMFGKLVMQFNFEAWATYCDWVGEEIVQVLSRFHPEDSEEYQLQARLEDFLHEINSTILRDQRQKLLQALKGEFAIIQQQDNEALKAKEKEIIFCRDNIQNLLSVQRDLLRLIHEGIDKIEMLHPELIPLKITALSLEQLLTPGIGWSKCVLLCQILDQQLGVVSAVSGPIDDGRAVFVYAIRRAVAELSFHHPIVQVVEMSLGWDAGNHGEVLPDELRQLVVKHAAKRSSQQDTNGEWISFIP